MPIYRDGKEIVDRYRGEQKILSSYRGDQQIYSSHFEPVLDLSAARTGPYRVMFVGSSTTHGGNVKNHEDYVHNFMAHLTTDTPARAETLVRQNTGNITRPTTQGFHFLNAGIGGTTSSNYLNIPGALQLLWSYTPHLVIHMIGSNDYHQQVPIETYSLNVGGMIAGLPGYAPGSIHVLVHSYKRTDTTNPTITWDQYGAALKGVADLLPHAHFVDVSGDFARLPTSDYLSGDRVHATPQGYELLAKFIARRLGLNDRNGELVWGMDASEFALANGTLSASIPPMPGSLETTNATQSEAPRRPIFRNLAAGKWFDFDGVDDMMNVVGGFAAVHGMPITFYLVFESLGGTAGSATQPFFSRSVSGDNGWWWVWRERDQAQLKAAHSSAWGNPIPMGSLTSTQRGIVAVTMFANRRGLLWANSRTPAQVQADAPDYGGGPWMRSLRLGSNANGSNFSSMKMREVRFEHSVGSNADVVSRMEELAAKHNVTLRP